MGPARLPDHTLMFVSDLPDNGSAVPTVTRSSGDEVWGVLWEITSSDEDALDEYEGVKEGGYRKATIEVEAEGQTMKVLLYIAESPDRIPPSRRFVELLVRSAQAQRLPAGYVQRLSNL
jgi:gamma-glutamylcyclotransferase (GGCT)/AIG2-like uncharacterized protein YtfP